MPIFPLAGTVALMGVVLAGKFFLEQELRRSNTQPLSVSVQVAEISSVSLKKYHLGFANLAGALLWIELLQKSADTPLKENNVSWEYLQLHTITDLDPNFDRAYGFGAVYLSVLRQDKEGAKRLLEKWVHRFPNNWRAHYLLGHHLHFELGQSERGGQHLLKAAVLPGSPSWLASLGLRLLGHTGALAQAMRLSLELYSTLHSEFARARLVARVQSLNFAIQQAAWEGAAERYKTKHRRSPAVLTDLKPFMAEEARELAGIATEDLAPELIAAMNQRYEFRLTSAGKVEPVKSAEAMGLEKVGLFKPK